jgi:hypothetical protein
VSSQLILPIGFCIISVYSLIIPVQLADNPAQSGQLRLWAFAEVAAAEVFRAF